MLNRKLNLLHYGVAHESYAYHIHLSRLLEVIEILNKLIGYIVDNTNQNRGDGLYELFFKLNV